MLRLTAWLLIGPSWHRHLHDAGQVQCRNEGVGKALLRELVARARDSEIYLTTLASTAPFYESANFAVLSSAQIPR